MKTVKDTCNYEEINVGDVNETDNVGDQKKSSQWNIMRQVLVCSTMWTIYFIYGLQMGAPTVIIPQLRREANSSLLIDDDLSSWITSMFAFGALPWVLIVPATSHKIGRKKTYILICLIGFMGSLIIYLSKTISQILIGKFVLGIILGANHTISPLIITEYTSPSYRGLYLTIKSASAFWGMWVANIIGTFWHWKNIYLMMFVCHAYTLTIFFWPESPYWLAKERRFDHCKKTYRKLRGNAEKDLDHIISYYTCNEDNNENRKTQTWNNCFNSYIKIISCETFYRPMLLVTMLGLQYFLTGKLICSMYAIQILKKITGNEAMAYKGMLILDGVTVCSSYCGCIVSRYCGRRKLLFTTSFISIALLYIFSVYLFLIRASIIIEYNIISIFLLAIFSVTVCCGPMILLSSIYGELISFRYQQLSSIMYGVCTGLMMIISLKASLFLFKALTLPGTFLFFAISSSIITFVLYLYLPETKNKSITEIEAYFIRSSKESTKDMATLQPDS